MIAKSQHIGVNGTNMSKANAIDVAKFFIEKANAKNENDLTNLKLQKLLYFAQGTYLGVNGLHEPLFAEPIEAWKLGPVVRDVYNTFSFCGASPITLLDVPSSSKSPSSQVIDHLEKIWDEYGIYSAAHLVDLTHKQSPWVDNYDASSKNTIPMKSMADFFKK